MKPTVAFAGGVLLLSMATAASLFAGRSFPALWIIGGFVTVVAVLTSLPAREKGKGPHGPA